MPLARYDRCQVWLQGAIDTLDIGLEHGLDLLAGGAVVFTVVAYGTRRLLERLFGPTVEPERVVVVVRGDQSVEVLPSDHTVVVDDDDDEEGEA